MYSYNILDIMDGLILCDSCSLQQQHDCLKPRINQSQIRSNFKTPKKHSLTHFSMSVCMVVTYTRNQSGLTPLV